MFGTTIHWTTFFYLLIDTFLVLFAAIKSSWLSNNNLNRYLVVGFLFVAYNFTGGILPMEDFPGPFILQYIISYGVAIAMCLYVVYYFYKEYDISLLEFRLKMSTIVFMICGCFLLLFLLPYFITASLYLARIYFTLPVAFICMIIFWGFYKKIWKSGKPNIFIKRRNILSLISLFCIALLPILTVIGDYQWLTFSVVNLSFFVITAIEIDRHLYLLERKARLGGIVFETWNNVPEELNLKMLFTELKRREIEIAFSILQKKTYRQIGEEFFIVERTVSKHASNIFKKTGVRNKTDFLKKFALKKGGRKV